MNKEIDNQQLEIKITQFNMNKEIDNKQFNMNKEENDNQQLKINDEINNNKKQECEYRWIWLEELIRCPRQVWECNRYKTFPTEIDAIRDALNECDHTVFNDAIQSQNYELYIQHLYFRCGCKTKMYNRISEKEIEAYRKCFKFFNYYEK